MIHTTIHLSKQQVLEMIMDKFEIEAKYENGKTIPVNAKITWEGSNEKTRN